MTSATYLALPEGPPWPELIEGQLVEDPPPGAAHQVVQSNLFHLLSSHVRAQRLGKVYANPTGVFLSDRTVLEPDLVFLSTARRHLLQPHGIQGAPDLVIEIISPRSHRRDLHQKRALYAAAGVPEYWIVAVPERRVLQLTTPESADYRQAQPITSPLSLVSFQLPGLTLPIPAIFEDVF